MIENNTIKWRFPLSGGGQQNGFNDGAIDHFKGHRLSSLVREVIQNSLDAGNGSAEPIKLKFEICELDKSVCSEITELKEQLIACRDVATQQKLKDGIDYYKNAIKLIDEQQKIRFLVIHDWNTTGLEGPIEQPYGAWYALIKGSGVTQKPDGSLGSYGHGSKAPFSLSAIRSILYLTKIRSGQKHEVRFQGKSILQSHIDPKADSLTQGTGYYGWTKNCAPLLDDQIPDWATEIRNSVTDKCGTSLFIPYYSLGFSEETETVITVIANFFYAIKNQKLEVMVGEEVHLNASNIEEKYEEFFELLETEKDEIDEHRIRKNLESIGCIINFTADGIQEVPGLGRFKWFIKVDEDLDQKRVAIARQNGMLICHNPMELQFFPLMKNFEMFVCVEGKEGSNLLKALENPKHDNFEFDRIEDKFRREDARKNYRKLMRKVRDIIKRHAKIELEDEIIDPTLDDLFRTISDSDTIGESEERSSQVIVQRGITPGKKKKDTETTFGSGGPAVVEGQGHRGGDGQKQAEGGPIPGKGKGRVIGSSKVTPSSKKEVALNNLRIVPIKNDENTLEIVFNNPGNGEYDLRIYKVGEETNEPILIKGIDGNFTDTVLTKFGYDERISITLETETSAKEFAIEAKILLDSSEPDGSNL